MANAISYAQLYKAVLDLAYQQEAKTSMLEANPQVVKPTDDPKVVKIARMVLQGLGDYSRDGVAGAAFPKGNITLNWDPYQLEFDRGRTFDIDAMDNVESEGLPAANVMVEFMRNYVIPEIDALRFARIAAAAGTSTSAVLTNTTMLAAFDAAMLALDNNKVPRADRLMFLTPNTLMLMKQSQDSARKLGPSEIPNRNFLSFDGVPLIDVVQDRFYSAVETQDGTTEGEEAGGYIKGTSAKNINFIILHKPAAQAITKHTAPRIFPPAVNQGADGWKIDYRIYHDLIVPINKKPGIYLHTSTT